MVQESRAQVNAAGGPGGGRSWRRGRIKRRRPCGNVRMPPSVITGRRGPSARQAGKALLPLDAMHRGRAVFHRTRVADGRLAQQHGILEAVGLGRQGGHHVAQKLTKTTLPFKSERVTFVPSNISTVKFGACAPSFTIVVLSTLGCEVCAVVSGVQKNSNAISAKTNTIIPASGA